MTSRIVNIPLALPVTLLVSVVVGALVLSVAAWLGSGTFVDAIDGSQRDFTPITRTAGQSIIARHAGLRSVAVLVSAEDSGGEGSLALHVRPSALTNVDLRVASIPITATQRPTWYEFEFDPILDSHNQYYYLSVERAAEADTQVHIARLPAEAYADGAMYLDGTAQQAQLALRLGFDRAAIVYDLLRWIVETGVRLMELGVILVIPGLAAQTYLLPLPSWRARLAVAACISLSLYPLLLVWQRLAGLHAGAVLVWLTIIVACASLILRAPRVIDTRTITRYMTLARVTWLGLLLLITFTRWFVLRQVDTPMLGDSVQHTMIAQLLVDNGGLFSSWEPYVPYGSMTTHFGFHAAVAAVSWVTGASVLNATLYTGQFLNILAIVVLSLLAGWVIRSEWAGVGSLLFAGLMSPTPNVYVNWGRYPQLAGQVIAVAAIWWILESMKSGRSRSPTHRRPWLGNALVGALLFAGTALAYYRMPYYVVIIVIGALGVNGVRAFRAREFRSQYARQVGAIVASGLLSVLVVLPWLGNMREGALVSGVETGIVRGGTLEQLQAEYQIFQSLGTLVPAWMIVLAVIVVALAIARSRWRPVAIALWGIALCLLPATRLLHVPGANQLQVFAVVIGLYMPVSVVSGFGLDAVIDWLHVRRRQNRARTLLTMTALAVVGVSAVIGTADRLRVYEPRNRILAMADLRAMDFVRQNIAANAKILVNGFLVYGGTSAVGSDGGWYIPLLTGRRNTMPPQYALVAEHPEDPQYNREVVEIVAGLQLHAPTSPEGVSLLCRTQITHVYIGQDQGRSGNPPPDRPLLSLASLESSPAFRVVYRQDRVALFSFDRALCT